MCITFLSRDSCRNLICKNLDLTHLPAGCDHHQHLVCVEAVPGEMRDVRVARRGLRLDHTGSQGRQLTPLGAHPQQQG